MNQEAIVFGLENIFAPMEEKNSEAFDTTYVAGITNPEFPVENQIQGEKEAV